jgi:hypothetical protein
MEGKGLAELLRLVNDRLLILAEQSRGATTAFWCECGWPGCRDQLYLTQSQYASTGAPLLAPGHTARHRTPLPLSL